MVKIGLKFEVVYETKFVDDIAIVNQVNGLNFDVIDDSQNYRSIQLVWAVGSVDDAKSVENLSKNKKISLK